MQDWATTIMLEGRLQHLYKTKNEDARYWKGRAVNAESDLEDAKEINGNLRDKVAAFAKGDVGILQRMKVLENERAGFIRRLNVKQACQQSECMDQEGPPAVNVGAVDNDMMELRRALSNLGQTEDFEEKLSMLDAKSVIDRLRLGQTAIAATQKNAMQMTDNDQLAVASLRGRITLEVLVGLAISHWVLAADIRDFFWDESSHRGGEHPYGMLCDLVMQRGELSSSGR